MAMADARCGLVGIGHRGEDPAGEVGGRGGGRTDRFEVRATYELYDPTMGERI